MASKKDRKTVRRDGPGAGGADIQKGLEVESCQRLLEAGAIGARTYNGPNLLGPFMTRQDRLLSEMKWVAVDVYEQRKLSVAQCRLMSDMIRKYWVERSRAFVPGVVPEESRNASQSGRPAGSPRSNLTTPTGRSPTPNGLMPSSPEEGSLGEPDSSAEPSESMENDFLIPIEPFVPVDESFDYNTAVLAAVEWAVQQNLSKRGVDALRCNDSSNQLISFNHSLVSPVTLETQRTIFQEVVATSVMARAPNLFSLTSTVASVEGTQRKPLPTGNDRRVREATEPPSVTSPKHFFVSAIYSSFTPKEWSAVEDSLLRECVRDCSPENWELVASTFSWRMKLLVGQNPLRSATECMHRFGQLAPIEPVPTDTSRRKKVASTGSSSAPSFTPVALGRGRQSQWKIIERRDEAEFTEVEEIETDNPFLLCRSAACPPATANSFERRGLFAIPKPPTNYFAKAFFHFPFLIKSSVHAIGAATRDREALSYCFIVSKVEVDEKRTDGTTVSHGKRREVLAHHNPLIEEAHQEAQQLVHDIAVKASIARLKMDSPKRAFGVEEMVRKNAAAVPGNVPMYISGQMVCPAHPSFVNMTRIAEMTLGRLISSVSENPQQTNGPPPQVPVSIASLFQYCALFRKKYPAVFTSQQKINKPSMPAPRNQTTNNTASRIVARPPPPTPSVQKQAVQSAPVSLPQTPVEPVSAPVSAVISATSSAWVRSSQRPKRGSSSGPGSKAPPSPDGEAPPTPQQKSAENAFMVAGGPSLYGQFNHQSRKGR